MITSVLNNTVNINGAVLASDKLTATNCAKRPINSDEEMGIIARITPNNNA